MLEATGLEQEQFRSRLINAIAEDPQRAYWDSWIIALVRLVVEHRRTTVDEVSVATES